MTVPTYDLSLAPPATMAIDLLSSSIESAKSMSGVVAAIDASGGGLWMCKYGKIDLGDDPARHRYWNQLRNILNGGVRPIIVPLITDWVAPVVTPRGPVYNASGNPTITAHVIGATAVNAGTIAIKINVGGALVGGETFAINHPTKGWRCYSITEVDSVGDPDGGGAITYTVGIRPPLREAVANATVAEFVRPRCLMRLAANMSLGWAVEKFWQTSLDIEFYEAF